MKRWLIVLALLGLIASASACGGPSAEDTPVEKQPEELIRVVSVSGRVVPERWAALSFGSGGRLAEVPVKEGEAVMAEQALAFLDDADLRLAARAAAEALAAQEALLAQAQATPVPADLAAAEAVLESARVTLNTLEAAPDPSDLEEGRLNVEMAKNTLWATQLEEQTTSIEGLPPVNVQAIRARAAAAEQALRIAELHYERVQEGAADEVLAGARVSVAQGQAAVDRLERGASDEELDGLRAVVRGARVAVDQVQRQLEQTQLLAPFDGTVVQIDARAGEQVAPGVPVMTMADLDHLLVQTTDLDELDLARVRVGQAVDLTFDALSEAVLHGTVTRIADMASTDRVGASFVVFIELHEQDPRLRWGMSVFVDIRVD